MSKIIMIFQMSIQLCCILFLFAFQSSVSAETQENQIDELMQRASDNNQFNGTMLVARKGNVIYKNVFGLADYESKRSLTLNSPFYLASVSKQFTAMGIMILKEQGKLSYRDKLSKYFPEFPDYGDKVTIEHLMTHTSGIRDYFTLGIYKKDLKNSDVLRSLVKQESLYFEPGDQFAYSNSGYMLLSMIVAKVSELPFHEFISKHIFKPLEMKESLVFDESKPVIANRAIGYNRFRKKDDYEILTTGDGGIFSTVEDMYKWSQALYTEKLVTAETLKQAFIPFILNDNSPSEYGFGWSVLKGESMYVVQHTGGLAGYRAVIRRDLLNETTVVMLSNSATYDWVIFSTILKILNGRSYELPKIRTAIPILDLDSMLVH